MSTALPQFPPHFLIAVQDTQLKASLQNHLPGLLPTDWRYAFCNGQTEVDTTLRPLFLLSECNPRDAGSDAIVTRFHLPVFYLGLLEPDIEALKKLLLMPRALGYRLAPFSRGDILSIIMACYRQVTADKRIEWASA